MKPIKYTSVFFLLLFTMFSSFCFSQISLGEAINKTDTSTVPFNMVKGFKLSRSIRSGGYFTNPSNIISDKIYQNVNLTQYFHASEIPEQDAILTLRFNIPNSNRVLLVVSFGNFYGDNKKDVICVANPDGTIVSMLIGTVVGIDAYVKQFRITAQHQIIVTTIIPNSTTSIPFSTFTSFDGHRRDITYSITDQGQIIQVSIQDFYSKTYTRTYLGDLSINLWDGGETPN